MKQSITIRVAEIIGHSNFIWALDVFLQTNLSIVKYLHSQGITEYTAELIDAETVKYTFDDPMVACHMRIRYADQLI